MISTPARACLAFAAAFALMCESSVPARAAVADRAIALGVTFRPRMLRTFEPAPLLGELDLHVYASGRIVGFFRPESDRSVETVSGVVHGRHASLDIGPETDGLHVDGTLDVSRPGLTGTAMLRSTSYDVDAVPCTLDGVRSILCQ